MNTIDNIIEKIPFLKKFPFSDFTLKPGILLDSAKVSAEQAKSEIVAFDCTHGINTSINMFEKEIWLLNSISPTITKLNDIQKTIDLGLETTDILAKRDTILACEEWTKSFTTNDKKESFSQGAFIEVLDGIIKLNKVAEPKLLIDNLNKLHDKKGIIRLEDDHERIILAFYQFQLIYFKMVLGIVIASKISI